MTEPITSLPEAVADRGALPMPVGPDWETAIRAAFGALEGAHHQLPPGTEQAVTERLIESLGKYVLVPKWEYELLEGQRDRATRAEQRIAELEGVTIDRLHRKVDSLKAQQAQDDAEYATAIAERDRARAALREACDQIAKLESDYAGAAVVSEALHRRLTEEQLAGSALYAALTMPTTPEQRQAALDQFTAVARKVSGTEAAS